MRSDTYEADILVFLFNTSDGLAKFSDALEPDHFQNEVYGSLYDIMKHHWNTFREVPTQTAIEAAIADEFQSAAPRFYPEDVNVLGGVLGCMFSNKQVGDKWVDADLTKWCRNAVYKNFNEKANFALGEGRPDKIDTHWRDLQQKLVYDGSSEGTVFWKEWDNIIDNYLNWQLDRVISTGYHDLDSILGGGLYKGEFGLVWGPPNVGKSFMLGNLGFSAQLDHRVLHLSNEMSEQSIAIRYVTMQADAPKLSFYDTGKRDELTRVRAQIHAEIENNLVIRYLSADSSAHVVGSILEKAKSTGEPYELVLIDYLDNFDLKGIEQDWLKLEKICQVFSDIAKEYDVCIVAATHCDQKAYGRRVASNKHLNRSKTGKDKVVDFSVFMGQDTQDQKTGTVILTVTKMRDREGKGRSCALRQMFETGKFDQALLPDDLGDES